MLGGKEVLKQEPATAKGAGISGYFYSIDLAACGGDAERGEGHANLTAAGLK